MNKTMTDTSNIERIVMRRVRLLRILGLIISTATLAVLTTIASLWGIGKKVWVARVFENAPSDILLAPKFFWAAFLHTSLLVQILSVLTLASLVYLVWEVAQLLRSTIQ